MILKEFPDSAGQENRVKRTGNLHIYIQPSQTNISFPRSALPLCFTAKLELPHNLAYPLAPPERASHAYHPHSHHSPLRSERILSHSSSR